MKKLSGIVLVLAAGMAGVALAATAAGAPARGTKLMRPHGVVVALAISRSRVAYALGGKVFVWSLGSGKRTKVSGRQTEGDGNVADLAIAGSRVVWYMNEFGNLESDDYLFTNSLAGPKERLVARELRSGDACGAAGGGGRFPPGCAGKWLRGLVGSGSRILVNRWTTNSAGTITHGGLYALKGTRFEAIARGTATVEAVAADSKRVAALHPDGTIALYSSTGKPLFSVTPTAQAERVALSGRNLVVLEPQGKLALYDASTGLLRKTFTLHGHPDQLVWGQALAVQGNIAVYSTPVRSNGSGFVTKSAIRALNLSSGRDHAIGRLAGQIILARTDSAGLVYANESRAAWGPNRLVFLPLKEVAAAVS